MTKEMFEWITKWQKETFTQATPLSAINHLKEELVELIDSAHLGNRQDATKEYADCFLLLFGSAALYGLSYDDICKAINDKMEINKARQWGKVNDQGYVKHIEP
jgi:NTP pyrophosphatase (non-canonical NTP hydrolase)